MRENRLLSLWTTSTTTTRISNPSRTLVNGISTSVNQDWYERVLTDLRNFQLCIWTDQVVPLKETHDFIARVCLANWVEKFGVWGKVFPKRILELSGRRGA